MVLPGPATVVLTDYLNVVRTTDEREVISRPQPLVLTGGPHLAWLKMLGRERPHLHYTHVKSHTGNEGVESQMNEDADHEAKAAHSRADFVFPYPTFTLPRWALYNGRWIEGDFKSAVQARTTQNLLNSLPPRTKSSMCELQGLRFAPPYYPYRVASSTYAAQIGRAHV